MEAAQARRRLIVTRGTKPVLPHHIKLRYDTGRGRWLILAPERVFNPDDIAVAVLQLCDGERTVHAIAELLADEYAAARGDIETDITAMLQDLADKGVIASC